MNERRGMANWLDPKAVNVARLLRDSGYATAHVGKWHLGSGEGAPSPKEYGFDFVRATTSNDDTWTERNEDPFFRAKSTGLFVDEAVKVIESNKDRPFYLQLWTLVPHATLNPTEEQLKPYANAGPGGKGFPHRSAKQIFYASVTDLDVQIGRLLAKLDELKLTGNTLVVFSSDNGPEEIAIRNAGHSGVGSPGPFRGRKRSLYEGGIRVPFIVRFPGVVTPWHVDSTSVISGTDFLPTVCSFAGVKLPKDYRGDGEDRSGAIRANDKPSPRTKPLHWEWRFNIAGHVLNKSPILAIRDGKWKLLFNPDRSRVELYDIPADPSELNNLAEKHPDIVERLAKRSLDWQLTLQKGPFDPAAGKNDYPWPKEKP
jgi:N-acetylgalactosamine-6-sulfatase